MNSDSALVDEIVRQVLRQLNGLPGDDPARPTPQAIAPATQPVGTAAGAFTPAPAVAANAATDAATAETVDLLFPPRQDPGEGGIGNGPAGRLLAPPAHIAASAELLIGPVIDAVATGGSGLAGDSRSAGPTGASVVTGAPAATVATPVPGPAVNAGVTASTAARATVMAATEVRLSERVITGELLRRLAVGSVVRVASKALLTPSARDAVASLKLQVLRETPGGSPAGGRATSWLVLTAQPGTGVEAAVAGWRAAGGRVELRRTATPAETAEQAIGAICRGEAQGVLVLSPEPEWVVCLANRNERVRGASVATAASLGRLAAGLKFNLLALEGRGLTAADWNSAWPTLAGAAGGAP